MTETEFIEWAKAKGFKLGLPTPGHLGRKDAWTKTYGKHPALHVRYFIHKGVQVRKEASRGWSAFHVVWTRPLTNLCILNGKITIKL
jgi:hypothetical protein